MARQSRRRRRDSTGPDVSGLHARTIQRRYPASYHTLLTAPLDAILLQTELSGDPTFFDCASQLRGWHKCGCQVFRVGQTLGSLLSHTSLQGVSSSEVRLPFDCYYLQLDGFEGEIWGGVSGMHPVSGVYVMRGAVQNVRTGEVADDCLFFLLWGDRHPDRPELGDALLTFQLPVDALDRPGGLDERMIELARDVEPRSIEAARLVVALVLNLPLYLESTQGDASTASTDGLLWQRTQRKAAGAKPGTRKRAKLDEQLSRHLPSVTVTTCGAAIEAAGVAYHGPRTSPRRHWVRGHWKLQAHGPGRKLRRRLWIKPYLRGDEGTEVADVRLYDAG